MRPVRERRARAVVFASLGFALTPTVRLYFRIALDGDGFHDVDVLLLWLMIVMNADGGDDDEHHHGDDVDIR